MLEKPSRGTDILDWCVRLFDELQWLLQLRGDSIHIVVGRGGIRFVGACDRVSVGTKWWTIDTWTGSRSDFLAIYFDGITPPAYISEATFKAALVNGMPSDSQYIQLSRHFGDHQIPRS